MIIEEGMNVILFLDKEEYKITSVYCVSLKIRDKGVNTTEIKEWYADLQSDNGAIIKKVSIHLLQII